MKCWSIPWVAVLLASLLTGEAFAQNCPNGRCSKSVSLPPQARVFKLQPLGPVETKILGLERDALEKWYAGDPTAYIAMMAEEIGYFEPSLEKRLDGREPLQEMFEALRGKIHAEKFDMLNTRVQATENMAVLSCNLLAIENGIPFRWNCTEVFQLNAAGEWKLIHSHWSPTAPGRR